MINNEAWKNSGGSRLTIGSLFDGSGTAPLAATMCGIEPVWCSEVEPFCIAVTRARFPKMKHYGNICTIKGGEIEPVDIICGGSPCFPAGTLVLTDKGYRSIESILIGDKVFTHKGKWQVVSNIGHTTSETVKIKGSHYGLEVTPNHPIWSAETARYYPQLGNGKRGNYRKLGKVGEWTPAKDMAGKRWAIPNSLSGLPIPIPSSISWGNDIPVFNEDLMYLLGRWLGDGWIRNGQRSNRPEGQLCGDIFICAGYHKAEALEKAMRSVFGRVMVIKERTVVKFRTSHKAMCGWIKEQFGEHALNKGIPAWVYCMDEPMRDSLLNGYFDSDGHKVSETQKTATTISKNLAHGIRLLAETLGYSTFISRTEVAPITVVEGRTVNQHTQYTIGINCSTRSNCIRTYTHSWCAVRQVLPCKEKETVYNITVEEDNSYVVEGFVVHNCQDLSVAGKRAGLEGGERSVLFHEQIRIIKEMRNATNNIRPRFAIWENVPGAFSSNGGEDFRCVLEAFCKIADESADIPRPKKWASAGCIVGDGWSVAYRTLDAQYWGVAQRRRRIFLVADFRSERAGEILFKSEGVPRDFTPSGEAWQDVAGKIEGGAGESECWGIDAAIMTGGNCTAQGPCVYKNISATLKASAPHGVCHAEPPITLKIRSGCEGGGKGALIQVDKSATLRCNNDQTLFEPICMATQQGGAEIRTDNKAPTLTAMAGMSGNNQPVVCYGIDQQGGKGALIQVDKSATLGCNNDQTLFEPICYGICSDGSNSMLSDNPNSGIYIADTARTLDGNGGNPSCNQGGIAVVEPTMWDGTSVAPTLTANNAGGNQRMPDKDNFNAVIQPSVYENNQFGGYREGCGTLKASGGDHGVGSENIAVERKEDENRFKTLRILWAAYGEKAVSEWGLGVSDALRKKEVLQLDLYGTSVPIEREEREQLYDIALPSAEVVAGWLLRDMRKQQERGCASQGRGLHEQQSAESTEVVSSVPHASASSVRDLFDMWQKGEGIWILQQALSEIQEIRQSDAIESQPVYSRDIVRRLTPLEASRLQGFPDGWCDNISIPNPTESDISFWQSVWDTYQSINGKKPKSRKQIIKWLQSPRSDAAEYKMWGNGMALPCVLYIMQGLREAGERFEDYNPKIG